MAVLHALTRKVSPGIGRCELTYLKRTPIDAGVASRQHEEYERCLRGLRCTVESLPAEPDLPDSVFVEDVAIVLDELAIVTRPGAPARRPETVAVAAALARHRRRACIEPPGTLDGGDVLVVGRQVYVGRSRRSDESGFQQLHDLLAPLGYEVTPVPVRSCLHLKSAVTCIGADHLLVNRSWVDGRAFAGLRLTDVDPSEPWGANALLVNEAVLYPAAFVRTRARMAAAGIAVVPIEVSELAKAEGGVTCCSLLFEARSLPASLAGESTLSSAG
jgi:dimethylargininase